MKIISHWKSMSCIFKLLPNLNSNWPHVTSIFKQLQHWKLALNKAGKLNFSVVFSLFSEIIIKYLHSLEQKFFPKCLWFLTNLIDIICLQTGLKAKQEEGPSEDVQEEGETNTKGCEENWTDWMGTPGKKYFLKSNPKMFLSFYQFCF